MWILINKTRVWFIFCGGFFCISAQRAGAQLGAEVQPGGPGPAGSLVPDCTAVKQLQDVCEQTEHNNIPVQPSVCSRSHRRRSSISNKVQLIEQAGNFMSTCGKCADDFKSSQTSGEECRSDRRYFPEWWKLKKPFNRNTTSCLLMPLFFFINTEIRKSSSWVCDDHVTHDSGYKESLTSSEWSLFLTEFTS